MMLWTKLAEEKKQNNVQQKGKFKILKLNQKERTK